MCKRKRNNAVKVETHEPRGNRRALRGTTGAGGAGTSTSAYARHAVENLLPEPAYIATLSTELLDLILRKLDAVSLSILLATSKIFRTLDKSTNLRLAERSARDTCIKHSGPDLAARWRSCNWLERLRLEETRTLFDRKRAEKNGFTFLHDSNIQAPVRVRLDSMGPRLLVSDLSTDDTPLLRWKIELQGNSAVEFGVIPVSLQDTQKALHKCFTAVNGDRPSGFSSAITIGSVLPLKLPLMKGSVIEILARRNRVEFIIMNPSDGAEQVWHKSVTVSKQYKGPKIVRFELEFHVEGGMKLAVTSWAKASFKMLHTSPMV